MAVRRSRYTHLLIVLINMIRVVGQWTVLSTYLPYYCIYIIEQVCT